MQKQEPLYECKDSGGVLSTIVAILGVLEFGVIILVFQDPKAVLWVKLAVSAMLAAGGLLMIIMAPIVKTKVYADRVEVSYGPLGLVHFVLMSSMITNVQAVEYNALMDFGGWGIKNGNGKYKGYWAYTASFSNKGLVINTSGKNYLIGCSDPDEAETMIRNMVMKKGPAGFPQG